MKLIDRYLGRTIAASTAGVMGVLLTVYFFSLLIGELDNVGRGNYEFIDALLYVLLLIPRQAYELFPLVALLGCMLGLGQLATSSELTVIRAAGVSVRRILGAVLKFGLIMVVLVTVVGEAVSPPLEKYARIERAKEMTRNFVNSEDGLWAREGQTFVHIRRLLPGGTATGITLYRFNDALALEQTIRARTGEYRDGAWHLERITQTDLDATGMRTRRSPSMEWNTTLTPEVVDIVAVPPENLSIADLIEYVGYLRENGLDSRRYEAALWTRIMAPFATAGMVLLAVPFIFGSLRSVGIGQRITYGALLGIGFYLINGIFSRLSVVYDMPPFLNAVIPTLVVYGLWWGLMQRVR